ncbi:unnamed protein product [Ectocarpus sp. 4 AP-2014]
MFQICIILMSATVCLTSGKWSLYVECILGACCCRCSLDSLRLSSLACPLVSRPPRVANCHFVSRSVSAHFSACGSGSAAASRPTRTAVHTCGWISNSIDVL